MVLTCTFEFAHGY